MCFENLLSVSDISKINPTFSESTIRWWIFNADQTGFDSCLVRVGGRVYIDRLAFDEWLESNRVKVLASPEMVDV